MENLIEALKSARCKEHVFKAVQAYSQAMTHGNHAPDPELMAEVVVKLRCCVANAEPAPSYVVPFTLKLLLNMAQDLGPGWYVAVSAKAYAEVVGSAESSIAMDPVTRYDLLLAGELATAYGTKFYTDALYHPDLRMLQPGYVYVMSADGSKGCAVRLV